MCWTGKRFFERMVDWRDSLIATEVEKAKKRKIL